jgi:hypothetical protein
MISGFSSLVRYGFRRLIFLKTLVQEGEANLSI